MERVERDSPRQQWDFSVAGLFTPGEDSPLSLWAPMVLSFFRSSFFALRLTYFVWPFLCPNTAFSVGWWFQAARLPFHVFRVLFSAGSCESYDFSPGPLFVVVVGQMRFFGPSSLFVPGCLVHGIHSFPALRRWPCWWIVRAVIFFFTFR